MQAGTHVALAEFAPSYKRATVTQVSLAVAGFLSALAAWRSRSDAGWLIGGVMLLSVIPFCGHGDTADEQAVAQPGNGERPGASGEAANPLGTTTRGKERFELGFPADVPVPPGQRQRLTSKRGALQGLGSQHLRAHTGHARLQRPPYFWCRIPACAKMAP
jgi:hypothetical protein